MGKSTPKAPAAPDPVMVANAQGAANLDTARAQAKMNMVDEYSPYGSSTFQNLGDDRYSRTTTLAPQEQAALDRNYKLGSALDNTAIDQIGRLSKALGSDFNYDGMPAAPTVNDASRKAVEDAIYGRATARLDPQFQQQQEKLQQQLANQGINLGSDAYDRAMRNFGMTQNDAYSGARNDAVTQGGSEQSRLFGLESTARQNAIQEALAQRNQPLNEITALMGASPAVATPQFSATPQESVANTDVAGIYQNGYTNQLNAYNQAQNRSNSTMGSLFGLAGTLGGAALGGPAGAKIGSWVGSQF